MRGEASQGGAEEMETEGEGEEACSCPAVPKVGHMKEETDWGSSHPLISMKEYCGINAE